MFANLTSMNVLGLTRERRQLVARAVVAIAAAFILLVLHDAVATAAHDDVGGAAGSSSAATAAGGQALAVGADAASHVPDTGRAGECGLAIMCVVAMASVGAVLLLRAWRRDAALWSNPRAQLVAFGVTRSSYPGLTPLQSSCVLRC
ncbi:MAG: hypothetical protein JWR55_233 [Aeromicrobium sp.]|jgi:hypothetical protein|nr:hypothetical protein [Aeromicrobium sp.]